MYKIAKPKVTHCRETLPMLSLILGLTLGQCALVSSQTQTYRNMLA